MFYPAAFKWVR